MPKVEVLRDLFDALATHGSLNYILGSHSPARHNCCARITAAERMLNDVRWNLRSRREDFPDFEGSF